MKVKWNKKASLFLQENEEEDEIEKDLPSKKSVTPWNRCTESLFNFFITFLILLNVIIIVLCLKNYMFPDGLCSRSSPNARQILYRKYIKSYKSKSDCDIECLKELSETFSTSQNYIGDNELPVSDVSFFKKNITTSPVCVDIPLEQRYDCHPEFNASEASCKARGCCWQAISQDELKPFYTNRKSKILHDSNSPGHLNLPYCFYPRNYDGYSAINKTVSERKVEAFISRTSDSPYPFDIKLLKIDFLYETEERIRIKIYDPTHERWEPPVPEVPGPNENLTNSKMYTLKFNDKDATFKILRSSNNQPVFNSEGTAPLIFADQFLQISTMLSSSYIYGLGQHIEGLVLDTLWHQRVLWNLDQYPLPGRNLYGSHPFFLNMEQDGNAHGFLLLNSNALDAVIQPTPAVTFHVTGGILDMYLFMGPTPDAVIRQYTDVIGKPTLPSYWNLGYHQCRFGYGSVNRTKEIWKQTIDAGIPFDVQWNDIDYMKGNNDFTYDKERYAGLPEFVKQLHDVGMHYVPIIDPGISASEPFGTYPPFDEGIKAGIFIRNQSGDPFIGKVWNAATTTWPDFTHPSSVYWWTTQFLRFHEEVEFDGAWIDMNEPSNFWSGQEDGCPLSNLDDPPYLPPVHGGRLCYHTVCMNANHHIGLHYNIHNLYSFTETIATNVALKMVTKKRPFIISRASFPGQGQFGGHWTGDVVSDWKNLWLSISDVLNFNMFGIPLVGADICGFNGNTTASLCLRWMQLGAFYPFARNHNTDDAIDQDPVSLGDDVVTAARQALQQRYALLPYLYTLFFRAYKTGLPVARPLFFQYPQDQETYTIDTQFMWGEGVMIVPALVEDITHVSAYVPAGVWYDWYSGSKVSQGSARYMLLDTPLDSVTLLVLGGNILPIKPTANTTTHSRLLDFELLVALNENGISSGHLYWDDGDSLDAVNNWVFSSIGFESRNNSLFNNVYYMGYDGGNMMLSCVKIYGVDRTITTVTINETETTSFSYFADSKVLKIWDINKPLYEMFNIRWK